MIYEIPLTPEPQRFSIPIGATTYNLRFGWNENDMGGWFMDIADDAENPILMGIPLVTGSNLLEQFAYLGIEGKLQISTDTDSDAVPTFDNLGLASHLFLVTSDE